MAPPVKDSQQSSNSPLTGTTRYYSNCRGTNYLPAMKSEWEKSGYFPRYPSGTVFGDALPGNNYAVSDSFQGVNKTSQWWYYSHEDNANNVRLLRTLGMNAIRVFSNIYVWARDRDRYINAIKDFHKICDKNKMRVQWVLWDGVDIPVDGITYPQNRTEATSALEVGLLNRWTRMPCPFEVSSAAQASNFFTTCATPFITDMVSSVSSFQSLWSFDIVNEHDTNQLRLVSSTSFLLSSMLSSVGAGITFGHGDGFQPYSACPSYASVYPNAIFQMSSHVNFASIHTYGTSRYTTTRYLLEGVSGARMIGKPFMVNESHNANTLQWPDNDLEAASAVGVGVIGFDGLIDHGLSYEPFRDDQGILFWDGEVRSLKDASGYTNASLGSNWFSNSQINRKLVQKSTTTNNGADGGYYSGVIPEHLSYNADLYVSAPLAKWEAVKSAYYTLYGSLTNSKNFTPYTGHPLQDGFGYGFANSGIDYEQAYNMLQDFNTHFPPLSSMDGSPGEGFANKNKSVVLRTLLLNFLSTFPLEQNSGITWSLLRGTDCDSNPIPVSAATTFYNSFSAVSSVAGATSKLPGVNNTLATSATMLCKTNANCLELVGGAIDWAAYDAIYSNSVTNLKTCLNYMVSASETNSRYRLF